MVDKLQKIEDTASRALLLMIEAARIGDEYPLTQQLVTEMLKQANASLQKAKALENTGKLAGLVGQAFPVGPRTLREFAMAWLVVHGGKDA
jgi:hypothetical protein